MTTSEPTTKICSRCGKTFEGDGYLCAKCDAELEKREGEYGVKFNEPTTGEIVRELRAWDADEMCNMSLENMVHFAIDRLESQEQAINYLQSNARLIDGDVEVDGMQTAIEYLESVAAFVPNAYGLIDLINSLHGTAIELTARAEQAEADVKKFAHTSHTCGHNESGLCKLAADDHGFCEKCPAWVYRGQPQDGEGK